MKHISDDERITLTLISKMERLQHDSGGLIQWVVTLNNQERLVLTRWARQRAPWLVSAIERVPLNVSYAPETGELEREVGT